MAIIDVDLRSFDPGSLDGDQDWGNAFAIDLGRWKPELHPRDSRGRFRDKWGLSPAAMSQVDRLLRSFDPPPLRSDRHASSYLRQQKGPRSKKQQEALDYFLSREGNEDIQSALRAGYERGQEKDFASTERIRELDGMMQPLEHDLILSRVMGPDAFGLPPERMSEVEEWTGQRVQDLGFSPMNVGSPHQIGAPHVEMRILVPRGTKAIIVGDGGDGPNSRTVILDRQQPVRLGKIQSDGRGGFYVLATVAPKQEKGSRPVRTLSGRELPVGERSSAIEATPEELQRRGLEVDQPPGPQEQPERFGPVARAAPTTTVQPAPERQPSGPIAPAPEGPPLEQTPLAREQIPVGAGRVTTQQDLNAPEAPAPAPAKRGGRQVIPEPEARLRDRENREVARQKMLDEREARLQRAQEQLLLARDREIQRKDAEIERLRAEREAEIAGRTIRADEGTQARLTRLDKQRNADILRADQKNRAVDGWPHNGEETRIALRANRIRAERGDPLLDIPEDAPEPTPEGEVPEAAPVKATRARAARAVKTAPRKRVRKAAPQAEEVPPAEVVQEMEAAPPGRKAAPRVISRERGEDAILERADRIGDNPQNPTDRAVLREADRIRARRAGEQPPPEAPAPPVKRAPRKVAQRAAPEVVPEAAPEAATPEPVTPATVAKRIAKRVPAPEAPQAAPAKRATKVVPGPKLNEEERNALLKMTPAELKAWFDSIAPPQAAPGRARERRARKVAPEAAPEAPTKKAPTKAPAKKAEVPTKAAPEKKIYPERKPKSMAELQDMSDDEIIRYADGLEGPSQNSSEVVAKRMAQAARNRRAEGAPPNETPEQLRERLSAPRKEAAPYKRAPGLTTEEIRAKYAPPRKETAPYKRAPGLTTEEIRAKYAPPPRAKPIGPPRPIEEIEAEQKLPRPGIKKAANKAVKLRAENFDKNTPDVPGQEGGLLRITQRELAEGSPVAPLKKALQDRSDFHRRNAEIEREDPNDLTGEAARHEDRLADIYENAANAIGKRGPNPDRLAPGDKVERTNKDKSITKGTVVKRGRLTYIDWEDGESQRILPSRPGRGIKKVGAGAEAPKAEKPATVAELRKEATALNVPGRSRMDRAHLEEALAARRKREGESDEEHAARLAELNQKPTVTRAAPRKVARKAAAPAAEKAAPAPAKKAAKKAARPSTEDRVASALLDAMPPKAREEILDSMTPEERADVDGAVERVKGAKKVARVLPASPERQRVRELAGEHIPDPQTHQASQAITRATRDLQSGKPPKDVAARLRQDAASLNSDGDPLMNRVVAITPAEQRSAKRGDVKGLRALADAILRDRAFRRTAAPEREPARPSTEPPEIPGGGRVIKFPGPGERRPAKKRLPRTAEAEVIDLVPHTKRGGNVPETDAPGVSGVQAPTKAAKVARPRVKRAAPAKVAEAPEAPAAVTGNSKADYAPGGAKHIDLERLTKGLDFSGAEQGRRATVEDLAVVPNHQGVLDNAQQKLNGGASPASVARDLRGTAQALRNVAAIRYGGWDEKDEPTPLGEARSDPAYRAERKRNWTNWNDRADQFDALADRLEKTKRPRAPRPTPTDTNVSRVAHQRGLREAVEEAAAERPVKRAPRKIAKAAPEPEGRLQRSPRLTPEQRADIEPLSNIDKARYRSLLRDRMSHDEALAQTKRERQAADLGAAQRREASATKKVRNLDAFREQQRIGRERQDEAIDEANRKDLAPVLDEAGVKFDDLSQMQRTKVGILKNRVEKKTLSKKRAAEMLREDGDDRMAAIANVLERRAPRKVAAKKAAPEAPGEGLPKTFRPSGVGGHRLTKAQVQGESTEKLESTSAEISKYMGMGVAGPAVQARRTQALRRHNRDLIDAELERRKAAPEAPAKKAATRAAKKAVPEAPAPTKRTSTPPELGGEGPLGPASWLTRMRRAPRTEAIATDADNPERGKFIYSSNGEWGSIVRGPERKFGRDTYLVQFPNDAGGPGQYPQRVDADTVKRSIRDYVKAKDFADKRNAAGATDGGWLPEAPAAERPVVKRAAGVKPGAYEREAKLYRGQETKARAKGDTETAETMARHAENLEAPGRRKVVKKAAPGAPAETAPQASAPAKKAARKIASRPDPNRKTSDWEPFTRHELAEATTNAPDMPPAQKRKLRAAITDLRQKRYADGKDKLGELFDELGIRAGGRMSPEQREQHAYIQPLWEQANDKASQVESRLRENRRYEVRPWRKDHGVFEVSDAHPNGAVVMDGLSEAEANREVRELDSLMPSTPAAKRVAKAAPERPTARKAAKAPASGLTETEREAAQQEIQDIADAQAPDDLSPRAKHRWAAAYRDRINAGAGENDAREAGDAAAARQAEIEKATEGRRATERMEVAAEEAVQALVPPGAGGRVDHDALRRALAGADGPEARLRLLDRLGEHVNRQRPGARRGSKLPDTEWRKIASGLGIKGVSRDDGPAIRKKILDKFESVEAPAQRPKVTRAAAKAVPEAAAPEAPAPAKRVRKLARATAPEAAPTPTPARETAPELPPAPPMRRIRERKPTPIGEEAKLTTRLKDMGGDPAKIQAELDKDSNNQLDVLREVAQDLGLDDIQPKPDLKQSIVEALTSRQRPSIEPPALPRKVARAEPNVPENMRDRVRPGGMIALAHIRKNDRVMVEQARDGSWHPSRKITATPITVDRQETVQTGTRRGGVANWRILVGHDDQGNEIRIGRDDGGGYSGVQTFRAARPEGAKVGKAAKATPEVTQQRTEAVKKAMQPLQAGEGVAVAHGYDADKNFQKTVQEQVAAGVAPAVVTRYMRQHAGAYERAAADERLHTAYDYDLKKPGVRKKMLDQAARWRKAADDFEAENKAIRPSKAVKAAPEVAPARPKVTRAKKAEPGLKLDRFEQERFDQLSPVAQNRYNELRTGPRKATHPEALALAQNMDRYAARRDRVKEYNGLTREQFDALPAKRQKLILDDLKSISESGDKRTIPSNRTSMGTTIRGADAGHVHESRALLSRFMREPGPTKPEKPGAAPVLARLDDKVNPPDGADIEQMLKGMDRENVTAVAERVGVENPKGYTLAGLRREVRFKIDENNRNAPKAPEAAPERPAVKRVTPRKIATKAAAPEAAKAQPAKKLTAAQQRNVDGLSPRARRTYDTLTSPGYWKGQESHQSAMKEARRVERIEGVVAQIREADDISTVDRLVSRIRHDDLSLAESIATEDTPQRRSAIGFGSGPDDQRRNYLRNILTKRETMNKAAKAAREARETKAARPTVKRAAKAAPRMTREQLMEEINRRRDAGEDLHAYDRTFTRDELERVLNGESVELRGAQRRKAAKARAAARAEEAAQAPVRPTKSTGLTARDALDSLRTVETQDDAKPILDQVRSKEQMRSLLRAQGHSPARDADLRSMRKQALEGYRPVPKKAGDRVIKAELTPEPRGPKVSARNVRGGDVAVWNDNGTLRRGLVVDEGPRRRFIDWDDGRRERLGEAQRSKVLKVDFFRAEPEERPVVKRAAPRKIAGKAAAPEAPQAEEGANRRVEFFDRARTDARLASDLDQTLTNEGSDRAILHQIDAAGKPNPMARLLGVPAGDRDRLRKAFETKGREGLRKEIANFERRRGITRIGKTGEVVPYDPEIHHIPGKMDAKKGDPVLVLHPGHKVKAPGDDKETVAAHASVIPDRATRRAKASAAAKKTVAEVPETPPRPRVTRAKAATPEAAAKPTPESVANDPGKLRRHAATTRSLGEMRMANNPPGSYHYKRGQQDLKDADRMEQEADALEKAAAPVKKAVPERPRVTRAAKEKAAPEAPEAPTKATGAARRVQDLSNPEVRRARGSLLHQDDTDLNDEAVAQEMDRIRRQDDKDTRRLRALRRTPVDESVPLRGDPEGDGGIMHGDSPSMQLAQKLARRGDRNGSANKIMEMRRGYSARPGRDDPDASQKAIDELRLMRLEEKDPAIRKLYDDAIGQMDAEPKPVPDVPDGTPQSARQLLSDLNRIPLARREEYDDRLGRRVSSVDQLAQVYRDIDSGKLQSSSEIDSRISDVLRRYHESRDGAYQMWDLSPGGSDRQRNLSRELRQWARGRENAPPPLSTPGSSKPEVPEPRTDIPDPNASRAARARQRIDARKAGERRSTADGSGELADILNQVIEARQASDDKRGFQRAVRQRLLSTPEQNSVTKTQGYDDLRAALAGRSYASPEDLERALRQELGKRGITMTSTKGAQTRFNPDLHRPIGEDIPDNADVEVIRHGLIFTDDDGTVVTLQKPVVRRLEMGGRESSPLGETPAEVPTEPPLAKGMKRFRQGPLGVIDLPADRDTDANAREFLLDIQNGARSAPDNIVDYTDRHMNASDLRATARYLGLETGAADRKVTLRNKVIREIGRRLGFEHREASPQREELEKLNMEQLKARLPEGRRLPSGASKRELVDTLMNDEDTPGPRHATMSPEIKSIQASVDGGTTDVRNLGGGTMGRVTLVQDTSGKKLVRKRLRRDWHLGAEEQADAETLTSRLGREIGVLTPPVYQPTSREVYMDHVDGKLASRVAPAAMRAAVRTPEGRRLHLLDVLTGNVDRHPGNFIINSEGKPVAIDNSLAFRREMRRSQGGEVLPSTLHSGDPFRRHYKVQTGTYDRNGVGNGDDAWAESHPYSREELEDVREKLEALRPEFAKLNREDWHDEAMGRLDALISRTKPESQRPSIMRSVDQAAERIFGAPERPQVRRAGAPGPANPEVLTGAKGGAVSDLLLHDTGDEGVPVRRLSLRGTSGYVIQEGTAWRRNGVTYIVEHDKGSLKEAVVVRNIMAAHHASLPAEGRQYQHSYAWMGGRNPSDAYWAEKYGIEDLSSVMSGGGGELTVWGSGFNENSSNHRAVQALMNHEYGHNVNGLARTFMISTSPEWSEAGDSDRRAGRRPTDWEPFINQAVALNPRPAPKAKYRNGINAYAQSDPEEDFAESMALYLQGPIGQGRVPGSNETVVMWFRDLFPARAAILDQLFPDFARQQREQIAAARRR